MKYDYGGYVKVRADAPSKFRPDEIGAIVGMRTAPGSAFDLSGNEIEVYIVEYLDGSSIEIPEPFLIPDSD